MRAAVRPARGPSTKLNCVSANKDSGRTLDWRDRDRFAAHVPNTEHHRNSKHVRALVTNRNGEASGKRASRR